MGSKNRIKLGVIINFLLHFHRNFYSKLDIFMSKRVAQKIKIKHSDVLKYTNMQNFVILMEHTIASVPYKKCIDTINFIAYIDNRYILFALKKEKHHASCHTIYALNKKTLKEQYKQEGFKIIKKEFEVIVEDYITN
jgi:hypothetical protein